MSSDYVGNSINHISCEESSPAFNVLDKGQHHPVYPAYEEPKPVVIHDAPDPTAGLHDKSSRGRDDEEETGHHCMNSSADEENDPEYEKVLSANFSQKYLEPSHPQQSQCIEPFIEHSCYQASAVQLTKSDDEEHKNSSTALNSYESLNILGSDNFIWRRKETKLSPTSLREMSKKKVKKKKSLLKSYIMHWENTASKPQYHFTKYKNININAKPSLDLHFLTDFSQATPISSSTSQIVFHHNFIYNLNTVSFYKI